MQSFRFSHRARDFSKESICLILAVSLSITGCGSIPVIPEQNPDETARVDPTVLAVVTAQFVPSGTGGPLILSKGTSAAKGATAGGAVGGLEAISSTGDPLLSVLMLAVMVPLGIIAGAAGGAVSGSSQEATENSARAWEKATKEAHLQQRLRDQLVAELQRESVAQQILVRDDLGPKMPEIKHRYEQIGADAILEVAVMAMKFSPVTRINNEIAYSLAITVRARLIDTQQQTVRDEMRHVFTSTPHTAANWLANNALLFTNQFDEGMKDSAEAIVLEFFRIYYPLASEEPGRGNLSVAPYYVLQPEYPPVKRWQRRVQLSGDLQPTFRWESFPRTIDLQGAGKEGALFSDVSYDIALYSVVRNKTPFSVMLRCSLSSGFDCPQKPPYSLGPRIYLRTGLLMAQHRLEVPLQPCGEYGWTVRTHFRLNGHPRVTEWSGTYPIHPPWLARRALLTPGEEQMQEWNVNWFLFRAPPSDGIGSCSN